MAYRDQWVQETNLIFYVEYDRETLKADGGVLENSNGWDYALKQRNRR